MAQKTTSAESGRAEVQAYLARVPEPARTTLEKMRAMIRAVAPKEATEAVSYKIPSFQYKGALVWYAAFKNHCSFFPMDLSLLKEFGDELKNYKTSKGTIQFPVDKPLPKALVTKIVKARVALNEAKGREWLKIALPEVLEARPGASSVKLFEVCRPLRSPLL